MTANKNRYFIAIVPPSPLFDQALELKNYFKDRYQSKVSLNSPPHITLHMPFEWVALKEVALTEGISRVSSSLAPVKIAFQNFGCFVPRVIFIQVVPSRELTALQFQVRQFCRRELGLFNADYKDLPFHPHLTLAFRDLKKPKFAEAWEEFKGKTLEAEFLADRICLLKYEKRMWRVCHESSLGPFRLQR